MGRNGPQKGICLYALYGDWWMSRDVHVMAFFAGMPFQGVSCVHLIIAFVGPATVGAGGDPFHEGTPRGGYPLTGLCGDSWHGCPDGTRFVTCGTVLGEVWASHIEN